MYFLQLGVGGRTQFSYNFYNSQKEIKNGPPRFQDSGNKGTARNMWQGCTNSPGWKTYQSRLQPITSLKGSPQQKRRPNHMKDALYAARRQEKGRKYNTDVRNVELGFVYPTATEFTSK